PHPSADRRRAGDGRDRAGARRRHARGVRVRRGRQPADAELLRLPRAARARHAAARHRLHREPVAVHAPRHERHGRGRRRRHPRRLRCAPGCDRGRRVRQLEPVPARVGAAERAAAARGGGGQVKVEGERTFDAPRATVWSVLNDPSSMAKTMPGVESFDVHDDRRWTANVKIPLGLGGMKMKVDMEKTEEREPEFAKMAIKGQGVGAMLNMETSFTLSEAGAGTLMRWSAEVKLAGPVASMGQRVLQPIVNQQVGHVLGALDEQVQGALATHAEGPKDYGPPAESDADPEPESGTSG